MRGARAHLRESFKNIFEPRKFMKFASSEDAEDESINLVHGDIVL